MKQERYYIKRYFEFIEIMKQERHYKKRYFKFIKMMKQERYYVKRHGGVFCGSVLAGRSIYHNQSRQDLGASM